MKRAAWILGLVAVGMFSPQLSAQQAAQSMKPSEPKVNVQLLPLQDQEAFGSVDILGKR